MIVAILYFPSHKHCPFSCHFSSLIFTIHRQFPVLEEPFHLLQKHPKTPWETPEELPGSETSVVMTFKHMVKKKRLVKKKIWLSFQSMLRGSPGFMLKAYKSVTLTFSEYVLLLNVALKPSRPFRKLQQLLTLKCDITLQLVRGLPRFLPCSVHRLLLCYHQTRLQSSCPATRCKHFLWVLQPQSSLQSKKTASCSVWNPGPWEGVVCSFCFTCTVFLV